jgi:hypothetical protein
MSLRCAAIALLLAGLLGIGCGGISSPSKNQQETFTGTLEVGGIVRRPVNVSNGGEFSVKITQLSPTATAIVGTAWAQGSNCEIPLQQNSFSTLNTPALVGAIFQKGAYCVAIFDVGALTVAQNFTLVVSHP